MSVFFQPGNDQKIWVGSTFGLLYSPDDGVTWYYTCEMALGYDGVHDPVFAVTAPGTLFATMVDGLRVSRDGGCTWDWVAAPLSGALVSDVQVGGDGAVWAATQSTAAANDVVVSRNDGMTFTSTGIPADRSFFRSLRVAASDPGRVYVTGYTMPVAGSPAPLFYRTDDGAGAGGWMEIPFMPSASPQLNLVGVSRADPDVVFVRVNEGVDTVYRSDDGGVAWTPILTFPDDVTSFISSDDGMTIVIASVAGGAKISRDAGVTWNDFADAPHFMCAGIRDADEEMFLCSDNWQPDSMALGRTDLTTATRVFRFLDIVAPLQCGPTTTTAMECPTMWCIVCLVFGCPDQSCYPASDASTPDGGAGADDGGGACCGVVGRSTVSPGTAILWGVLVLGVMGVMRRRR